MSDPQRGGAFLVEEAGSQPSFIPENLSIEQKELAKTVHDFVVNEVLPKEDLIEEARPGLMPKLLRQAAGLGILMAEIPVEYGGLGLGKVDATAIAEGSTLQGSFNVSYMCHTGIASAPLIFYGTEDQKKRYLPRLADGDMLAAFALTEPEAGSDAMAITTRALPSKDKRSYIINGRKQFITCGGFADLFTVFAKTEEGITAFLVERNFKGVSVGKEEKKMGIHGSSTVPLTFENVEVPVGNLLGEPGKGHHIAFNVLNVGRLKLGSACTGVARHLVNLTYNYTKERVQFGGPIFTFQMIQEKLAMMAARTLLLESMVFRVAAVFDEAMAMMKEKGDIEKVLREYAIEAAVAKVYGSEALFYVADDAIQLHGGYGYCEEYGIERYFRDCRVNRIFEGTNEINRLVITGTILKMAVKGQIDIFSVIGSAPAKIRELIASAGASEESRIFAFIEVLKRLILSVGGAGVQRYAEKIQDEQYILGNLADMVMELYAIESTYMRARQLKEAGKGPRAHAIFSALFLYIMNVAADLLDKGRRTLMRSVEADSKDVGSYTKAMFGCLDFIRGDQHRLAIGLIDEIDKAEGYPF